MPEIRVAIYDDNGWRGPNQVYQMNGSNGYQTYSYTLPGYFYNTSQYVHNWYFWGWQATWNYDYGYKDYKYRMEISNGTASGNNNSPIYTHGQRFAPGSTITLWMWHEERWDFYFAITDVTGVLYTVYYMVYSIYRYIHIPYAIIIFQL
jgi:hypothetical protein